MGVIKRQSLKYTIVQYLGIAIGAVSMTAIYPRALDVYGLIQTLISAVGVVSPFVMLGVTVISVKYFPIFRDESKKHHGFFGLMMILVFTGCLIFFLTFPWIRSALEGFFLVQKKPEWYTDFLPTLLPLVIFFSFSGLFTLYASNFQRIVIPVIFEELLIKLTLPFLILGYSFWGWSVEAVVYGVVLNFAVAMVGTGYYIYWMGQFHWRPDFTFLTTPLRREMSTYGAYGILNAFGIKAAFYIDTIMVSAMIDLTSTGVYGIGRFIGDTLAKPVKSIVGISQPIIARALQENNIAEIEKIYKKSALYLLIFGLFLLTGIWVCLDDLFSMMPNGEIVRSGKYVVLFICLANLTDMATSVNNEIINFSKYYRFNFIALFVLSIFNVAGNLILIPKFQIVGAAMATFISISIFNLAKLIYIFEKFKIHPFCKETILVLVATLLTYLTTFLLPVFESHLFNFLVKGFTVSLVFPVLVYGFKISEEINLFIRNHLKKISGIFKSE